MMSSKQTAVSRSKSTKRKQHIRPVNTTDQSGGPSATDQAGGPSATDKAGGPSATDKAGGPSATDQAGGPSATDKAGVPPATDKAGGPSATDQAGGPSATDKAGVPPATDKAGPPATKKAHPLEAQDDSSQVMFFSSFDELAEYAQTLGIQKVEISDLQNKSNLDNLYVGGNVIGQLDYSNSQSGFTDIYIHDDSDADDSSKFMTLLVQLDVNIVQAYNVSTLVGSQKLFVHKGLLLDNVTEASQDFNKKIVISGTESRVWVVGEHPQATHGNKFWKKHKAAKKKRKKQKPVPSESACSSEVLPQHVVASDPGSPPSGYGYEVEQIASEDTFPDVPDFPDSAFRYHDSDDKLSSSSSDDESDSDHLTDNVESIPKRRKTTSCKYVYTKLGDLQPTGEKVNLFGVVKHFSPVGSTAGTDYCSSFTLVDESDPRDGVKCVLFNNRKELLPHIRRVGDILCIHRAFAKEYQHSLQINGRRFTSVLRFSGNVHKRIKPETGCHTYTFVHEDRQRVKKLRWWALKMKRNDSACKLSSVNPDIRFNLLCQVVSLTILESPQWCMVLTVWDGTMLPLKARRAIEADGKQRQSIEEIGFHATAYGYEEQVFIYNKQCVSHQDVKPGSIVYLYGVHAKVCREFEFQVELCMCQIIPGTIQLHPGEVEMITSKDYAFQELHHQFEDSISSESLAALSLHPQQTLFTLEEIQNSSLTKDGESVKFHCRVKLVGVVTPSLEAMVRLRCAQCDRFEPITSDMDIDENGISNRVCEVCAKNGQNQSDAYKPHCMYYLVIMISDYTGTVCVHVPHTPAIHLLNGILPTNFYQHKQVHFKVNKVLYTLTGENPPFKVNETKLQRPWLDVSVIKMRKIGQEKLFLFDTVLT